MSELDKLREIAIKIGFDLQIEDKDVRVYIFTQEFMDKFNGYLCLIKNYCTSVNKEGRCEFYCPDVNLLIMNLNNPVDYLYDLIK